MPVIWILIVGALLYLALRMLENHHTANNKKQDIERTPYTESKEPIAAVDAISELDKSVEKTTLIDMMPGLPNETKTELRQLNLTTPRAISDTSDKNLLKIKGIGPARLKQIRVICADAKDPESEFAV